MFDFARLAYWNTVALATCPLPGVPVSSIRYAVPGIAIELVKSSPKWLRKARLTLPKGQGPLLKEVIFDRFWAHVGLNHGLKAREAKTVENGSKQAPNGSKRSF